MPPSQIWIVDGDHWPRAYLRAELIERGYDAVGFETLADAAARMRRTRPAGWPLAIVVALDATPDDRAALARLARAAPLLATGGAVAVARGAAATVDWAAILRRPVTFGDLADAVERVVHRHDRLAPA